VQLYEAYMIPASVLLNIQMKYFIIKNKSVNLPKYLVESALVMNLMIVWAPFYTRISPSHFTYAIVF